MPHSCTGGTLRALRRAAPGRHTLHLLRTYVDLLPEYILSWKLYGALAVSLVMEALFAVKRRPLISIELMQDYMFGAVKRWLFVPFLPAYAAFYKSFFETTMPFLRWGIAEAWHPAAQFAVGFLAADFLLYVIHFLKHKIVWMWHFHTVHHSQRNLNPLTTHRVHVVENLFEELIQFLPLAVLGVGYPTWVGVRAFNWVWGHLIHANIRLTFGPLRYVFVSPQYHRVHHSIEARHFDKNFGERLIFWDWMFGTLYRNTDEYPETGVPYPEYPLETSARGLSLFTQLGQQYLYPFRAILKGSRREAAPAAEAVAK